MKKIIILIPLLFLFNGCVNSVAVLGSGAANGKLMQSGFNTAISYSIKKNTGKTPLEHAMTYASKNKSKEEKKVIEESKNEVALQPCLEFLEPIDTKLCDTLRKSISTLSKVKNLN